MVAPTLLPLLLVLCYRFGSAFAKVDRRGREEGNGETKREKKTHRQTVLSPENLIINFISLVSAFFWCETQKCRTQGVVNEAELVVHAFCTALFSL